MQSLSAQQTADALTDEMKHLIESDFNACIANNGVIHAIAIYKQNSPSSIVQDRVVSQVDQTDQNAYYTAFGAIAVPLMAALRLSSATKRHELLTGRDPKALEKSLELGDALNFRVQLPKRGVDSGEIEGSYLAGAPIDADYEYFVVAVNWRTGRYGDKVFMGELSNYVQLVRNKLAGAKQ